MRDVFLDTETTGFRWEAGHRIIEVGLVEAIDGKPTGKFFQCYVNPEREIDADAVRVHGLDAARLSNERKFREVAKEIVDFLRGARVFAHNANFDSGFLAEELRRCDFPETLWSVIIDIVDTQREFRKLDPGHRSYSMDNLMDRHGIDRSGRTLHGALLDARLLMELYYKVCQSSPVKIFDYHDMPPRPPVDLVPPETVAKYRLVEAPVSPDDMAAQEQCLAQMESSTGVKPIASANAGASSVRQRSPV